MLNRCLTFFLAIFLTWTGLNFASAQPAPLEWKLLQKGVDSFTDAAFGAGQFVVVGSGKLGGLFQISSNTFDWTAIDPGVQSRLRQVVFSRGRFVAVGDSLGWNSQPPPSGTYTYRLDILSSEDGKFWQTRYSKSVSRVPILPGSLELKVSPTGAFMVQDPYIGSLASEDALLWTSGAPFTPRTRGFASGNGHSVVLSNGSIYATTEGGGSVEIPLPCEGDFNSVAFGNGIYVGGNEKRLVRSTNGLNWTAIQAQSSGIRSLAFGDGVFVGAGLNQFIASIDGLHWLETTNILNPTNLIYTVCHGNGQFVAIGTGGKVWVSTNGMHWEAHALPTQNWFYQMAFGNGTFAAFSGDRAELAVSSNAVNWTVIPAPQISGIGYANGFFFGAGSQYGADPLTSQFSLDAISWSRKGTIPPEGGSVAFGGKGLFVISGGIYGPVSISGDGAFWNTRRLFSELQDYDFWFTAGALADDTFILVGRSGTIVQSSVLTPPTRLTIRASRPLASEIGQEEGAITITRSSAYLNIPMPVELRIDGTAQNGVDYDWITNKITIPPGQTSVTIPIRPKPDSTIEGTETISFQLQPLDNYLIESSEATVEIEDFVDQLKLRLGAPGPLSPTALDIFSSTNVVFEVETSTDLVQWSRWLTATNAANGVHLMDTNVSSRRFYRALRVSP
jgi:hypothetical protein